MNRAKLDFGQVKTFVSSQGLLVPGDGKVLQNVSYCGTIWCHNQKILA